MIRVRALSDDEGQVSGAIVCVEDVTQSAQLRNELEQQASHDTLTRLLNRRSIMTLLDASLTSSTGSGTTAIFVDLDRFKVINDRFGHLAGDELLRIVADRLLSVVRAGDALGRIGGDEFLIVCPDVPSSAVAERLARRVASALNREVALAGGTVDVRASVGVAYSNGRDPTSDELVGEADTAMYESKREGRGRPVTFGQQLAAR